MSRNDLPTRVSTTETVHIVEPAEKQDETNVNPLAVVHGLLRGRYWIAITLAVLGVAIGGAVGYRIKTPTYRSTAMIQVKPYIDRILYDNEKNGVLPMFDSFVESQVSLIRGQRVIDLAMQADEWKSLGRGLLPEAVAEFAENLEVTRPRGSEMIFVSVTDEDPKAAMAGAKAIVEAYNSLYGENDSDGEARKLQALEDRRLGLARERKAKLDEIQGAAGDLDPESLDRTYEFALTELLNARSQFNQHELTLGAAQSRAPGAGPATQPAKLTPEIVAQSVPQMRNYLDEKRQLEMKLELSRLGDNHPDVVDDVKAIAVLDKRINDLFEVYRVADNSTPLPVVPGAAPATVEELQARLQQLQEVFAKREREFRELEVKQRKVKRLQDEAQEVEAKLQETETRLERLRVEAPMGGRIDVVSTGDRPLQPYNDKRVQFAAVGALVFGGLGIGMVLLYGLLDRRVRNISDAHKACTGSNRVLGVLPSLPDDLSDPDQAALAAHSVHHIRAQLQMGFGTQACRALAITSPSPGAGKTSLSCALGLSFAASGSRTLLIDCDIIGGGLTARMDKVIRRKVGQILRRSALLDDDQVRQVIARADATGERFGAAAIALGFVEEIDIEHALEIQEQSFIGLREVLAGEDLMDCVTGTGTPGLFLLPLGSAGRQHVGQLSERSIRRIIEQARHHFDVVLIDTGPILGSLEASVVAMASDQVVLAVARGEDRVLAERSIEHLGTHGGNVAGIVFNRAHRADIISSGYSSSVSLMPTHMRRELPFDPASGSSVSRLGPIASAVVAATDMGDRESKN